MADVLRRDVPAPGVLRLVLDRPRQANALDRRLGEALLAALLGVPDDPATRCVLLTGAGRAFCAGDDLGAVRRHMAGDHADCPVSGTTDDPIYTRVVEAVLDAPVPVLVAINGASAGAGTEIACAADLRLASDRARIGSGLLRVAQVGTAVMLPRTIGAARATELYLTSRLVDAAEALAIGLVHEVVAHEQLQARALERAAQLAALPTRAIALYKALREQSLATPVREALRAQNAAHLRTTREVEDAVEGAAAFLDRRTPAFTGR